jgi:hypothetical protein
MWKGREEDLVEVEEDTQAQSGQKYLSEVAYHGTVYS